MEKLSFEWALESVSGFGGDVDVFKNDCVPSILANITDENEAQEALKELVHFTRGLHSIGGNLWGPFKFGVMPLLKLPGLISLQRDSFHNILNLYLKLIEEMKNRDFDYELTRSKGLSRLLIDVANNLDLYRDVLETAIRLTVSGQDPVRFFDFVPASSRNASSGNQEDFKRILLAFEHFILNLKDRGFQFLYPFAISFWEISKAYQDEPEEYLNLFPQLVELLDLIRSHNYSPYQTFEYGLTSAIRGAKSSDERKLILECALSLSSLGVNPGQVLTTSFSSVFFFTEEYSRGHFLKLLKSLSTEGISSWEFFGSQSLLLTIEKSSNIETLLRQVEEIHRAAVHHQMGLDRIFNESLNDMIQEDLLPVHEILSFIQCSLDNKIDPGKFLLPAVLRSFRRLERNEKLVVKVLNYAQEEMAWEINPVHFLKDAVTAAFFLCHTKFESYDPVLLAQHRLILSLENENLEQIFSQGLLPLSQKPGSDSETFLSYLGQLQNFVTTFTHQNVRVSEVLAIAFAVSSDVKKVELSLKLSNHLLAKTSGLQNSTLISFLNVLIRVSSSIDEALSLFDLLETLLAGPRPEQTQEALNKLSLLLDVEMFNESSLKNFLTGLASVKLGQDLNTVLIMNSADTLAQSFKTPESMTGFFADLQAIKLNQFPLAEQRKICFFVISSLVLSNRDDKFSLQDQVDLIRDFATLIPDGVEFYNLRRLYEILAGKCESFLEFVNLGKQVNLTSFLPKEHALEQVALILSRLSQKPDEFLKLMTHVFTTAEVDFFEEKRLVVFLNSAIPAVISASTQEGHFIDNFSVLCQLTRPLLKNGQSDELFRSLYSLVPLFEKSQDAWKYLIAPLSGSQGKGALSLVNLYGHFIPYIETTSDLEILKQIATQYGVRAPEILSELLLSGLQRGFIKDLSHEKEDILEFIKDIGFNDAKIYQQYSSIKNNPSLSIAAKKSELEKIKRDFDDIFEAIMNGSVTREMSDNQLFYRLLYYVFTPSYSVGADEHEFIFKNFEDHTKHITALGGPASSLDKEIVFSTGGYVLREGQQLNLDSWQMLLQAMEKSQNLPAKKSLLEIGTELFTLWIQNEFTVKNRETLIAKIYQYFLRDHAPLNVDLSSPQCLLSLKAFADDSAQEIIHAALAEFYSLDPGSFLQNAQHKIVPMKQVGPGLVKAIAKTVEELKHKKLDHSDFEKRIQMQLKGFELSDPKFLVNLQNASLKDLQEILSKLKPIPVAINPVQVYLRLFQDLLGEQTSKMQRELFGDGKTPGKLEFQMNSAGLMDFKIRFQVSKKKTHSPVGLCEGVCTASDKALWDNPDFMQVVFWGPDKKCLGGMHLLLAQVDDKRYLTLPGINPTLAFLKLVDTSVFLEQVLDYAKGLAEAWSLSGVLIPTSPGIHSNRAEIKTIILGKGWPVRTLPNVIQFSYRPYRYSFFEVYEVD